MGSFGRPRGHLQFAASARSCPVDLSRGSVSDLPSRAADHLFWLGRYAERSEHLARVLRCILIRLTGESGVAAESEWESLTEDVRLSAVSPRPAFEG